MPMSTAAPRQGMLYHYEQGAQLAAYDFEHRSLKRTLDFARIFIIYIEFSYIIYWAMATLQAFR